MGEREIVTNRWQEFSPEIQAAVIAAGLALLAWLGKKMIGAVNSLEETTIPSGYKVFVLASGRVLAASAVEEENHTSSYVLHNVLVCDEDGNWQKEQIPRLVVESSQVEFHYSTEMENDHTTDNGAEQD